MSEKDQSVDLTSPQLDVGEAFGILVSLAATASLTSLEAMADPPKLVPILRRERLAFDLVEEFLQIHLYGDCNADT